MKNRIESTVVDTAGVNRDMEHISRAAQAYDRVYQTLKQITGREPSLSQVRKAFLPVSDRSEHLKAMCGEVASGSAKIRLDLTEQEKEEIAELARVWPRLSIPGRLSKYITVQGGRVTVREGTREDLAQYHVKKLNHQDIEILEWLERFVGICNSRPKELPMRSGMPMFVLQNGDGRLVVDRARLINFKKQ